MRKILSLLTAFVLLFSSCVDEDFYEDTPQGNFDALWTLIDQNYCFFDYKHIDWDSIYAQYRPRLSNNITNAQLFEVMTDMLSELKDGHVNLYTAGDVARYWNWYEDYPKNWDQELRDAYLGTDYRIASGLNYRILDDNIGYLVCESFSNALGDGNISDALYYMRTCNGLIIDVRGNTGGQLNYAHRLAAHFTNERRLVGYTCYKTGPGHNGFSTPAKEYLDPAEGYRWQKPVIILTNRECYSACNIFVRDMKECPQVTLLGDRTGGGSGMPFTSELPNGWGVRFSASPSFDARMEQIEFGIAPDINCALDSTDVAQGHDTLIERARTLLSE